MLQCLLWGPTAPGWSGAPPGTSEERCAPRSIVDIDEPDDDESSPKAVDTARGGAGGLALLPVPRRRPGPTALHNR